MRDNNDNKHKGKKDEASSIELDTVKRAQFDNMRVSASAPEINKVAETPMGDTRVDVLTSPFLVLENVNEEINPVTGELDYLVTDLHLPGKNGLDLVVQRKYSSYSSSDVSLIPKKQRDKIEMYYWVVQDNTIKESENRSRIICVSGGYYDWKDVPVQSP